MKKILLLVLSFYQLADALPLVNKTNKEIYFSLVFFDHIRRQSFAGSPISIAANSRVDIPIEFLENPACSIPKEIHDFDDYRGWDRFLVTTDQSLIESYNKIFNNDFKVNVNFCSSLLKAFLIQHINNFKSRKYCESYTSEECNEEWQKFYKEGFFQIEQNSDCLILQGYVPDTKKYNLLRSFKNIVKEIEEGKS